MYVCVNFSVMLQTSRDGKLQINMLKEVISECSEGKMLRHLCNIIFNSVHNYKVRFEVLTEVLWMWECLWFTSTGKMLK